MPEVDQSEGNSGLQGDGEYPSSGRQILDVLLMEMIGEAESRAPFNCILGRVPDGEFTVVEYWSSNWLSLLLKFALFRIILS